MALFNNIERTYMGGRIDPRELFFDYLDRSARPDDSQVRDLLESWFEQYPHKARNPLQGRLQGDDIAYSGASFELTVHELLIRLGCEVTVNDIDGTKKQPDFRVRHGDCLFYVEATVINPQSQPVLNPAEEDVLAKIKTLRSPYFFFSFDEMKGELSKYLGKTKVVEPFQKLLNHTPEEVQKMIDEGGPEAAPSATITDNDWNLQGRLVPCNPPYVERPTVMLGPGRSGMLSSTPVRREIRKRAKKYDLDAPLVVAVNVCMLGFSEHEELEVLFEKEQYTIDAGRPDIPGRCTRNHDGIFVRPRPPHTRYTRLKGVIMFRNISNISPSYLPPWNLRAPCCLYLNPFAGDTKLPDVLYRLPHVREHEGKIQPFEGENIGRLLGIDSQTKA